jgi:curved DNA-binding protein CbpA
VNRSYYEILGLPETADLTAIKSAYRRRSLECHPDRGGTHEQMLLLNEAFEILANPETRRRYDALRQQTITSLEISKAHEDAAHARAHAEQYPRDWQQFESWADKVCRDFTRAEYDEGGRITNIEATHSGLLFAIIGGGLGLALGWSLGHQAGLCAALGTTGALAGQGLHRLISTSMRNRSQPVIIACNRCGQKLRVRPEQRRSTLKCGKCQHEFRLSA